MDGVKREHTASSSETEACVQSLLLRRYNFMEDRGLRDDLGQRYVFNDEERAAIVKAWSLEYHRTADQLLLQKRDSYKQPADRKGQGDLKGKGYKKGKGYGGASQPAGKPGKKGQEAKPDFGTNTKAVRGGKHSRFARHLQRVARSKVMAELILYAGRCDVSFLGQAHSSALMAKFPGQGLQILVLMLITRSSNCDWRRRSIVSRFEKSTIA